MIANPASREKRKNLHLWDSSPIHKKILKMKKTILGLVLSLLCLQSFAVLRTASVSGNWNSTTTWGGTVPVANDDIQVNSGVTVTINVSPANIKNVTLSGTLQFDATGVARNWTVTGTFLVNTGGSFTCAAPGSATTHSLTYSSTSITNNGTWDLENGTNKCDITLTSSSTTTIGGTSVLAFNKFTLNNTGGKFQIDYDDGGFTTSESNPTKLNVGITTADSMVIKQGMLIGCALSNTTLSHTFNHLKMGGSGSKITSSVSIFTQVTTITVNTGMILNDATNSQVGLTVNGSFSSPSMSQSNAATAFALNGPNCFGGASYATTANVNGPWNMTDIFVFVGSSKLLGGTEPGQPVMNIAGSLTWASSETHTIDLPFTSDDFYIQTCFFGTFDSGTAVPQMKLVAGGSFDFDVAFDVFNAEVQESSPLGSPTFAQISSAEADWVVDGTWEIVSGAALAVHSDYSLTINGTLTVAGGGEIAGCETETDDTGYSPASGPILTMGGSGLLSAQNALGLGEGLLSDAALDVAIKNRTADLDWNMSSINTSGTIDYGASSAQNITGRAYNHLVLSGTSTKTMTGTITVNGTLTIGTSTTLADGGFSATAKGSVINNGTHSGSDKIILGGTANQSLSGSGSEWGNITMNNSAGATCLSDVVTTGQVELTSGIITTSASAKLIFGTTGGFIGGSILSCVFGPVQKTTVSTAIFSFAIGKGTNYRPLSVTPASTSPTAWTAEYFQDDYSNTTSVQAPVTSVNTQSYWTCDRSGSANAKITLQWNTTEALADLNGLTVARWDASQWTDAGFTAVTGTASSGTITSAEISTFSPFTLGETNTIATSAITGSPFCPEAAVTVPFTSTGTFNGGNTYTAQLSSSSGDFSSPVILGTLASSSNSGSIAGVLPAGTGSGNGFRIRVVSNNPTVTGSNNGANLNIKSCAKPTGLASSSVTQNSATVSWSSVSCGVKYKMQYRQLGTQAWTTKSNITGTSFTITGLMNNTTYQWKVQTFCTSGGSTKSAYSPIQTFTTAMKLSGELATTLGGISVYPNPAATEIHVSFSSGTSGTARMVVYNAIGEVVIEKNSMIREGMNDFTLDVASFSTGVYLLAWQEADRIQTIPFIKE
jgi:hypothetical protein